MCKLLKSSHNEINVRIFVCIKKKHTETIQYQGETNAEPNINVEFYTSKSTTNEFSFSVVFSNQFYTENNKCIFAIIIKMTSSRDKLETPMIFSKA